MHLSPLEKVRGELEVYEIDMVRRLATGETLTGTPTITVYKINVNTFLDVTTDFLEALSPLTTGTKIQFQLKAASNGTTPTQPSGWYAIFAQVTTSQGRTPKASGTLKVFEK